MPANRRRTEITAPAEAWQLLGRLLEKRRKELGYTYRFRSSGPSFEADSGVNRRMQADFEKAAKDRINRFMPGSLAVIARGYQVTEESMVAVLRGEADALVPAAPPARARSRPRRPAPAAAPAPVASLPGETPPMSPERAASDRPWFDVINERRVALAARGVANPSGAQMFPDAPDDAKAWDGVGARLDVGDRVWLIADLRRRAAGRGGNSGMGTAGALVRGNVAGRGVMPGLPMTTVTVYRIQRKYGLRNPRPSRVMRFWGSSRCEMPAAERPGLGVSGPGPAWEGNDGRTRAEKRSGTRRNPVGRCPPADDVRRAGRGGRRAGRDGGGVRLAGGGR